MTKLSREQNKAIESFLRLKDGQTLCINASAGSGKTRTLIEIAQQACTKFEPYRVGAISYTKKSAGELINRLDRKLGFSGTVHSLAFQILAKKQVFKIVENIEKLRYEIATELFYEKLLGITFADSLESHLNPDQWKKLNQAYGAFKNKHGLYDFDDLLEKVCKLPEKLDQFDCLLVDEAQDLTQLQLNFIQSFNIKNVVFVGDDWQSIYGFRYGSLHASYSKASKDSKCIERKLTKTFRSHHKIIKLGNALIKQTSNFSKKRVNAVRWFGAKPRLILYSNKDFKTCIRELHAFIKKKYPGKEFQWLTRTNVYVNIVKKVTNNEVAPMTVHAAKGLEFENVLIFPIEKNLFPHVAGDYDEEVRVLYVAVTRAKQQLLLCAAYGKRASSLLPTLCKYTSVSHLAA